MAALKMAGIWQGRVARRMPAPAGTQIFKARGQDFYWLPISFAVLNQKAMGDAGLSCEFAGPHSVSP